MTLLIVMMGGVACGGGDNDEPTPPNPVDPGGGGKPGSETAVFDYPSWSFTLIGNDKTPDWASPDPHKYAGSMVGLVSLPEFLAAHTDPEDMLAAFVGTECRAAVRVYETSQIPLVIMGNEGENADITLRYYSSRSQMVFTAIDALKYNVDTEFSITDPVFVTSKYPIVMTATLQITLSDDDKGTVGTMQTASDVMAAMINSECRGVIAGNSSGTYTLMVFGESIGQQVDIEYYSASTRHKYMGSIQLIQGKYTSSLNLAIVKKN